MRGNFPGIQTVTSFGVQPVPAVAEALEIGTAW